MDGRDGELTAVPDRDMTAPDMNILNLANISVSHLDLVHLSHWTNLQILNLSSNKVMWRNIPKTFHLWRV